MLSTRPRMNRFGVPVFGLSVSLLATVGLSGCGPQDLEQILGDVHDAPSAPAGSAVPFQTLTDDVSSEVAVENRTLIRTAQGYVSFFGHAPPAAVDFNREWVIFYTAGTKPSGGFEASIRSLTRTGNSLVAVTGLVSPGTDCAVPAVITSPSILIKFAAQSGAAIQFLKTDTVHDCGPPTTSPCAAVLCPAGSVCVEQTVVCVRAPCPPIGVCVPQTTPPVRCGGIAGFPCPGGGRCVDDPSDSCDPNQGGADCGGICQCIQNVACIAGTTFVSSPQVCACVAAHPTP